MKTALKVLAGCSALALVVGVALVFGLMSLKGGDSGFTKHPPKATFAGTPTAYVEQDGLVDTSAPVKSNTTLMVRLARTTRQHEAGRGGNSGSGSGKRYSGLWLDVDGKSVALNDHWVELPQVSPMRFSVSSIEYEPPRISLIPPPEGHKLKDGSQAVSVTFASFAQGSGAELEVPLTKGSVVLTLLEVPLDAPGTWSEETFAALQVETLNEAKTLRRRLLQLAGKTTSRKQGSELEALAKELPDPDPLGDQITSIMYSSAPAPNAPSGFDAIPFAEVAKIVETWKTLTPELHTKGAPILAAFEERRALVAKLRAAHPPGK